jgi:excinuclease ABC subunit C
VALFLRGKANEVLMPAVANGGGGGGARIQRAARIRDKISRLQTLQSRQFVESAIAATSTSGQLLGAVSAVNVDVRGRHVGDRTFFPRHADAVDPAALSEIVPAFLEQHYVERPVPPTIVVPDVADLAALAEVLSVQSGQKVEIVGNPGGERRVWLAMALQNATFAIRQKLAQKATQEDRLAALQEALGLPSSVQRIECFDISHTMGEAAVASCVIFDRLAMQTSEYRKFNVTPEQAGDDYAALREALSRRCARIVSGEYPPRPAGDRRRQGTRPAVAANVLEEQGMHGAADRHRQGPRAQGGEEDIVFPGREHVDPIALAPNDPALLLIQQIRDEAHRFAVQGHRARRAKARTTSTLQEIAGIGAAKRRALLAHFGGVRGVQAASVDDIARVPGISRALAERIFAELH